MKRGSGLSTRQRDGRESAMRRTPSIGMSCINCEKIPKNIRFFGVLTSLFPAFW